MRLTPDDWSYDWAANCLRAAEEFNKIKDIGYELCIKGELLLFLAALVGREGDLPPVDNADTRRLKAALQLVEEHYMEDISIDRAGRRLRVQCQPLYAVVQGHDGPELYRVFE